MKSMYTLAKVLIFCACPLWMMAQNYRISHPDLSQVILEDAKNDLDKQKPYRFGLDYEVRIDLTSLAQVSQDFWISSFEIQAEKAMSLNFLFTDVQLAEGAVLSVKNKQGKIMLGPYTSLHHTPSQTLATGIVLDSTVVIELKEPRQGGGKSRVVLSRITYGYRSLLKSYGLGNSGACNVNVVCPEGNDWRDEIRSVAMIVEGGFAGCTGALINNTCQDGTPYFLTANHCLSGDEANWAFLFNWESPSCSLNIDGALNNTVSGAYVRASSSNSDFALLEMFSSPLEVYDPFYAGWNRTGDIPLNETTIHHPAGDVKKISFDYDPVSLSGNYWRINDWDVGTTEPGSSGSPLFNDQHQIIGQLYGGLAACSNNDYDEYGRFDISWDFMSASNQQLKSWLDACNTGETYLAGFDPFNTNSDTLDVSVLQVLGLNKKICQAEIYPKVIIKNLGLETLTSCQIDFHTSTQNGSVTWNGVLSPNMLDTVVLSSLYNSTPGLDTLWVSITSPNGGIDEDPMNNDKYFVFYAVPDPVPVILNLALDDWGTETTWNIFSHGFLLESGGAYSNTFGGALVLDTFCFQRDSCYTFTIYDSYGDGLSDDDGYYHLENIYGDTLAHMTAVNFGFQESAIFCAIDTQTIGVQEKPDYLESFVIYPNPSGAMLQILSLSADIAEFVIYDLTGRVLQRFPAWKGAQTKELDFPAGMYIIQARSAQEGVLRQKTWLKTE